MKRIKFKMEGVSTLTDLISKNDYAISFDLKDAYNHVPVHPSMRSLLGLAWRGKCYTCVGMPFGLNDAPRVFTMIMRAAVRIIREVWNVKTEVYLDDIVLLHQDPDRLKQIGQEVSLFLKWLGWTVNREKSHLIPSRTFMYLGWEWDSSEMTMHLTEVRRKKALLLLLKARKQVHRVTSVPVRSLAKLIGVLNAARKQFPRASLYMMKLNKLKVRCVKRHGWNGMVRLNDSISQELKTWTEWLKKNQPRSLLKPPLPQAIVTTDAAPTGWGATIHSTSSIPTPDNSLKRCGVWSSTMAQASSNKRELVAIHKALEEFSPTIIKNRWNSIQILTDNTTACYNINHKAASINLYHSLRHLFNLTDVLGISIASAHIQGILNTETDKLSRLAMSGDYSLRQYFYLHGLRNLKVIPKLDLFANGENRKCTRFCALHPVRKIGTEIMGNAMSLI
jgi:ribonuclease HI